MASNTGLLLTIISGFAIFLHPCCFSKAIKFRGHEKSESFYIIAKGDRSFWWEPYKSLFHFLGGTWMDQPLGLNFPSPWATMLALLLDISTAALPTPQKVLYPSKNKNWLSSSCWLQWSYESWYFHLDICYYNNYYLFCHFWDIFFLLFFALRFLLILRRGLVIFPLKTVWL